MTEPASIRYNNPGAMWGGSALAKKWGADTDIKLNDGKHQGNQIAVFPDKVHGAAAQFDLWNSSALYHNHSLTDAIRKWSGGNSSAQYVVFLTKHAPGLKANTVITSDLLASPLGIAMMKAQAWMEAGKPYPMTDEEWGQAQKLVFGGEEESPNPLLVVGSTGSAVETLQKDLGCKVTGSFTENSETEFALKLFQVRNGLDPDGQCGPVTWAKLNSAKETTS